MLHFSFKYGTKLLVQSRIVSLIEGLRKYSGTDRWIHDFARFCGLVDPLAPEHLDFYLKALTKINVHVVAEQKPVGIIRTGARASDAGSSAKDLNAFVVAKKADELVRSLLHGVIHINLDEVAVEVQRCALQNFSTSVGLRTVVPLDKFMVLFLNSWLEERTASEKRLMELFHAFDADKGGTLDMEEFQALLIAANVFGGVEGEQKNREMFQMYCEAVNISDSEDGITPNAFLVVAERELKHCINQNMELMDAASSKEGDANDSDKSSDVNDGADRLPENNRVSEAESGTLKRVGSRMIEQELKLLQQTDQRLREVLTMVAHDKGFDKEEFLDKYLQ
jgi:hypothetical protein